MPESKHNRWTRPEQLVALRLYVRMPFGRLHGRNPEIGRQAKRIGRTPGALAMKACNFAGLDPAFLVTNRRGLSGASNADRALWEEFVANAETIAAEAEEAYQSLDLTRPPHSTSQSPTGETESIRTVRARRVQSFFRAAVLTSYESKCAVSGLRLPSLLNASHIIPWSHSVERRADPSNGICLNALFDRAFDRGLMTICEDMRVVMSPFIREAASSAALSCSIIKAEGKQLALPHRFLPDQTALAYHRQHVFKG